MHKNDLIKEIRRCGMGTFVKYYLRFIDNSISNKDLITKLVKIEGYTKMSAQTKIRSARNIINQGKGLDTLLYIANRTTNNADKKIKIMAKKLSKQK